MEGITNGAGEEREQLIFGTHKKGASTAGCNLGLHKNTLKSGVKDFLPFVVGAVKGGRAGEGGITSGLGGRDIITSIRHDGRLHLPNYFRDGEGRRH